MRHHWLRYVTEDTVVGMTSQLPSPISTSQPMWAGYDLSRTFEMRFTSTPRGARLARRLAAHRLDTWGIPYGTGPHEEIVLVLGELTANAVRHGHVPSRDFHLLLRASGTRPHGQDRGHRHPYRTHAARTGSGVHPRLRGRRRPRAASRRGARHPLGLAPPARRSGQDGLGGVRVRNSHVSP